MKNHWVSGKEALAVWAAYLTKIRTDPKSLLDWLCTVLNAGEKHEVYVVCNAPTINFQRHKDGNIGDHLGRMFDTEGFIDLFHFTAHRDFSAHSRIAFFDEDGHVTERNVNDLGVLLRSLRSADFDTAGALMARCLPVEIRGPRIDFKVPECSIWDYVPENIRVRFSVCSDIWFPWVPGYLEDVFDSTKMYDNRILANCHTPRLNSFLGIAEETTRMRGGVWMLDEEASRSDLRFMLDTTGIRLDARPPGGSYFE